jgi:hypothetical protein
LALGATIDDPLDRDLAGSASARTLNRTYYIGNRFPVGGGLTFGLDCEFWRTGYIGFQDGTATRVRGWMMLAF